MLKINRSWLVVAAAALAVGTSSVVRAGDGGDGGDSGDNGMNPMYGDSYAAVEGQGHNVGAAQVAPGGAYAAHEMDGKTTPLTDQMHQTQGKMAEQARHNWDAMVERSRAMTDRMRTALNPTSSAAASTPSSSSAISSTSSTSTTSTTPGASSSVDVSQPTTDSGYRIAPVNPKGQAPTV